MKDYKPLILGIFIASLAAVLFWAGTAFAATSCFTDTAGNPYENAICWLKANGIVSGTAFYPNSYAKRSIIAQWLYKQVQIPPSTGSLAIAADVSKWDYTNSAAPIAKDISAIGYTGFQRTSAGYNYLRISPDIPLSLYGRNVSFVGFEMCYIASIDATLSDVYVYSSVQTSSPIGTNTTLFSDITDRTDTACHYYALSSPVEMTTETAGIFIRPGVSWNTANVWFYVGRTTLFFSPTKTLSTRPSSATILESTDGLQAPESDAAP